MEELIRLRREIQLAEMDHDEPRAKAAEKALEDELRRQGYEKLAWPAVPQWQHPTKGGFYLW